MLLDAELRAALHAQAQPNVAHGPVRGAIAICDEARTTDKHDKAIYQAGDWSSTLEACLVAWAATDEPAARQDRDEVLHRAARRSRRGRRPQGGDAAVRRDAGYAIRNLGPYTALAYDWLHDAPGMTAGAARPRARALEGVARLVSPRSGYRAHDPGSNYHAGYLIAATTDRDRAGRRGRRRRRRAVAARRRRDVGQGDGAPRSPTTACSTAATGPRAGSTARSSVAEYALARAAARAPASRSTASRGGSTRVLRHHVYALSPGRRRVRRAATPRPRPRTSRRTC